MRRDAYPEIGRRITISQGTKGPEQGRFEWERASPALQSARAVACHARESGHRDERDKTLDFPLARDLCETV